MKFRLKCFAVLVVLCGATLAGPAEENPHTTLAKVKALYTQKKGSEANAAAKHAVKNVDPAKVEVADIPAWLELFTMAQDYKGARTLATRWAEKATGEDKFKAQVALLNSNYRLKDYSGVASLLTQIQPPNQLEAVRLASLANGYVYNAIKETNKVAALKILAAGEKMVPKDGFANDRERGYAKHAAESLAATRKAIEDNPGQEAEAVQKHRTAQFSGQLGPRLGGSSTNTSTLSTNSFIKRGANLDRYPRPRPTTNAPAPVIPKPQ